MTAHAGDSALQRAIRTVEAAIGAPALVPIVTSFFDPATFTVSHLVQDPTSDACAIVDSVLDFDAPSGRTATRSAETIVATVAERQLKVTWILETHAHADHLTAAPWLRQRVGGTLAIGAQITEVPGMGHNLPEALISTILDAFEKVARQAKVPVD